MKLKLFFVLCCLIALSSFADVRTFYSKPTRVQEVTGAVFIDIGDGRTMQAVKQSADVKCGYLPYASFKDMPPQIWGINKAELEICWEEWARLTSKQGVSILAQQINAYGKLGVEIYTPPEPTTHYMREDHVEANVKGAQKKIFTLNGASLLSISHDQITALIGLSLKAVDIRQSLYFSVEADAAASCAPPGSFVEAPPGYEEGKQ